MNEKEAVSSSSLTPTSSPTSSTTHLLHHADSQSSEVCSSLSSFESIFTSYPPVLESLIAHLPTLSLLNLYRTSRHLRRFLKSYPLAWSTLSFRLPQIALVTSVPGNETPELRERQSRAQAIDTLLVHVIVECGTRLKSLDLCNTAVSGVALLVGVWQPRSETLQHLSVRGCKNISIKYHILPFLQVHASSTLTSANGGKLALKSLYAYRCRHHRRRPYLPSSLNRRDSDSEPTHELIELCHKLGIWTDTAWCPTPGGRCYRRKDYHSGRVVLAPGPEEVWVPFDRLWRSGNRIGPATDHMSRSVQNGLLWEDMETGHDGEPLGMPTGPFWGEGKHVTAHQRRSHRIFVDNIKCHECGEDISERCEQCSVRMHCMGCRKTLCASCAFDRPIKHSRDRAREFANLALGQNSTPAGNLQNFSSLASTAISSQSDLRGLDGEMNNRFWWAPGATRSPNLMTETSSDDEAPNSNIASTANNTNGNPAISVPPKLNMHWCCLEPIFSGGGGIAFLGPNLGGEGAHKIRAAPLPEGKGYEDPDFLSLRRSTESIESMRNHYIFTQIFTEDVDILTNLKLPSLELQASTCPRSLCTDCYRTFQWKVPCRDCRKPLCKEHDFRALKVRKCGFREFQIEREYVQNFVAQVDFQRPFPSKAQSSQAAQAGLDEKHSSLDGDTESSQGDSSPYRSRTITSKPSLPSVKGLLDMTPIDPTITAAGGKASNFGRQRASSFSKCFVKSPSMWSKHEHPSPQPRLPLPCHIGHPVQWKGCGAYFCQQYRPVGDPRNRCIATLKECCECNVLVCKVRIFSASLTSSWLLLYFNFIANHMLGGQNCYVPNAQCPCSFCLNTYCCPYCVQKPHIRAKCRWKEEKSIRDAAERAEEQRKEAEKSWLRNADEAAESLGEFFEAILAAQE